MCVTQAQPFRGVSRLSSGWPGVSRTSKSQRHSVAGFLTRARISLTVMAPQGSFHYPRPAIAAIRTRGNSDPCLVSAT